MIPRASSQMLSGFLLAALDWLLAEGPITVTSMLSRGRGTASGTGIGIGTLQAQDRYRAHTGHVQVQCNCEIDFGSRFPPRHLGALWPIPLPGDQTK